jgi:hypothetical protein
MSARRARPRHVPAPRPPMSAPAPDPFAGFTDVIDDLGTLRALVGEPTPRVRETAVDHIDSVARAIMERSPLVVLASATPDGCCEAPARVKLRRCFLRLPWPLRMLSERSSRCCTAFCSRSQVKRGGPGACGWCERADGANYHTTSTACVLRQGNARARRHRPHPGRPGQPRRDGIRLRERRDARIRHGDLRLERREHRERWGQFRRQHRRQVAFGDPRRHPCTRARLARIHQRVRRPAASLSEGCQ